MYTNSLQIAAEAIQDHGNVNGDDMIVLCNRWAKDALINLGVTKEYHLLERRIDISDCDIIPFPEGMTQPRNLLLWDGAYLIEPHYSFDQMPSAWGEYGGKMWNRSEFGGVSIGAAPTHFFFTGGDPSRYTEALLHYVGLDVANNGSVMIPTVAKESIKSYIMWMILQRERRGNRASVPQSEVNEAYTHWLRASGVSYGRLKMPSYMELHEYGRRKYNLNIVAPEIKQGSSSDQYGLAI